MNNKLNFTSVYYDKDLKELSKLFDQMQNIFDQIESRFCRKDTLEISTSVFNYMEKAVLKARDPHPFYRFCLDEIEIYIYCPRKGLYNIHVDNVPKKDLPDLDLIPYLDIKNCWIMPQSYTDLDKVADMFKTLVHIFIEKGEFKNGLF